MEEQCNQIYRNKRPEFLINRIIATQKYQPESSYLINKRPSVHDGVSVFVCRHDASFVASPNYCHDLDSIMDDLGEVSQAVATDIWEASELAGVGLGDYAPLIFEKMMGCKGVKIR